MRKEREKDTVPSQKKKVKGFSKEGQGRKEEPPRGF